jgi:hypothetical protein
LYKYLHVPVDMHVFIWVSVCELYFHIDTSFFCFVFFIVIEYSDDLIELIGVIHDHNDKYYCNVSEPNYIVDLLE